MKNEGRKPEVESLFGDLTPAPPPPGLREKILAGARTAREAQAWSPVLKAVALAGLAFSIACLALEPVVNRPERPALNAVAAALGPQASDEENLLGFLASDLGPADSLELRNWKRLIGRERLFRKQDVSLGLKSRKSILEEINGT